MRDIVERLRSLPQCQPCVDAADLIESLRLLVNVQATSNQVTRERHRLTDVERELIGELLEEPGFYGLSKTHARVLKGLLERLA